MYIVAIGWLYVALMMAITEHTAVAAVVTFLLYGVGPVALLLYILGTPARRRRKAAAMARDPAGPAASPPRPDTAGPVHVPDGPTKGEPKKDQPPR